MKTALIISGGDIEDDFALAFLNKQIAEWVIGADRGVGFLRRHGIVPTHIVGDFDSAYCEDLEYFRGKQELSIRIYEPEKDVTDTQIAVELALMLGSEQIYILGGMGRRVDHLLANVRILSYAQERGCSCMLVDTWNQIRVTRRPLQLRRKESFGKYVSLFALGEPVRGLTLKGFKYPLTEYFMTGTDPLGVSNEIVEENAEISFSSGCLVVVESRDGGA